MTMQAKFTMGLLVAGVACFAPGLNAFAQEASGDVGTLNAAKADKAFAAKPAYSPYAGRNFPTRPFLATRTFTREPHSMRARSGRG